MPYTEQQLQDLRDAFASKARRVRFGDREIEYRTLDELQTVIRAAELEIARQNGTPIVRQIRISTNKGL